MYLRLMLLAVVMLCFATSVRADQWDPPKVEKPFTGTAKGTVLWVHDSTWWFMLDVDELEPKDGGDASTWQSWIDREEGIKVGLQWAGPNTPKPDQHAWLKSLKDGQEVTIQLQPGGKPLESVRLAAVPAGGDGGGDDGAEPKAKKQGGTKFGPGKLVAPEHRGAKLDESVIENVIRIDPDDPQAFASLEKALGEIEQSLRAGTPTRVELSAGTHRGTLGRIDTTQGRALDTLLVIEGAGKGETVLSGSDAVPAAEWEDLGDGLYRTDWKHDWDNHAAQWETPKVLGHRAEMVFVDGQLMDQVLIEAYDYSISGELMDHGNRKQQWEYRGFTDPAEHPEVMPPGTFGVAERDDSGNKLYLRLPEGTSIDDALIEVSTRRQLVGFAGKEWSAPGKNNLVLRGLTVQHYASRTAGWGVEHVVSLGRGVENILIDGCAFLWNNSTGLQLHAKQVTVRDTEASYNGMSGFGGEFTNALLENNVTNFNNWRGAWGNMYGWNWGGVKFGGAHGGNQTIRGHEAIGNLTHGFWYDIHPHHIDIEDLVSVLNYQTGLDLELAQGPFTVKRALLAGNRSYEFTMSIVGDFVLEDSILYDSNSPPQAKLKKERVPHAAVNLQWYVRNDEHAKQRPMDPEQFVIRGCVIATPNENAGLILEHNGYDRQRPEYEKIDRAYRGEGNLLFAEAGDPVFTYVKADYQPETVGLEGWKQWTREQDATVADPGFSDPANLDFTLTNGSPLQGRASGLPTVRVDPAKIAEAERFLEWHKRAKELNGDKRAEQLKDAGVPEPQ